MTTYKELHGRSIVPASSNPAASGDAGKIFYNSTDNVFRSIVSIEAWSAGANTNISKQRPGACGTQTAGLSCGGFTAPPVSALGSTEEYNGTGWSTGGTLNTARGNTQLIGTQSAAAFVGKGAPTTPYAGTTELYNGTSWTTNPNSANDAYNYRSGCGTQTAGLLTGGNYPPTNRAAGNEHFDGTSFSEGGDLPQKQSSNGQAGTQTAAINSFGGTNNPASGNSGDANNTISLEYDGTTWTTGPNGYGVVALAGYSMGAGTQTDALFAGAPSTNSCKYDGTTFTVGPALAVAQDSSGQSQGPAGAGWICQGSPVPSVGSRTQEFNRSSDVVTAAAWSSGGNLNTARYQFAGAGSTPAGLVFGGRKETAPAVNYNNSEEYNGTSWTEGNNLNTARFGLYGIGTQTAGLACGGRSTPAVLDSSEEYDGTSYTEGNNLASARHAGGSSGTQTAGLIFNGTNVTAPGPANMTTTSQSYDGTSWTATNSCNTARLVNYGFGTQTAAISVGGNPFSTSGESFDGTNWTAISGTLNDGRQQGFSGGTSTNGLVCGGNSPPNTTNVEAYNGTIFVTAPSLSTARRAMAGTPGTSVPTGIFGAGGYTSTELTSTEEFTPESTAVNVKTITTS